MQAIFEFIGGNEKALKYSFISWGCPTAGNVNYFPQQHVVGWPLAIPMHITAYCICRKFASKFNKPDVWESK